MKLYRVDLIGECRSSVIIVTANSEEEAKQRGIDESFGVVVSCFTTQLDVIDGFKINLEEVTTESPRLDSFKRKRLIISSQDLPVPSYSEYLKDPALVKVWLSKYVNDFHNVSCDNLITLFTYNQKCIAWKNDPLCRQAGFNKDIKIPSDDLYTIREVLYETLHKCDGNNKVVITIE